ncbi:pathogenesis-related protein 1 [Striga asiatica]|uniref:Pathogenesis-related protein 1 n=1 Tax=Striga asiatica TaxID=4170 RepID=A0A5A7PW88_STRAF|nr:pathogenesis-related protein 1 [Striga asiatica]
MTWLKTPIPLIIFLIISAHAQNSPKDFVDAHNAARAEVGVQPLVWDSKVEAFAENYANERSQDCAMQHSSGPYGENLAAGSWDLSAKEAVDMWVSEKNAYDLESNSCVGGECLHYTQVVWNSSTRVGCGRALCKNGWTFVTCNYDPPGNYNGERPF